MDVKTPVTKLIKTNKAHFNLLEQVGVVTVGDFIKYFPRTYNDQSNLIKIIDIRTDQVNTIKGTISSLVEIKTRFGKKLIKARFTDDSGSVDVVWFNQPFIKKLLHNGQQVILSGKAKFELGKITLLSPDYEPVQSQQLHTARLVPVYHETEGLSSKWLREKIHPLLKYASQLFEEYLPADIIEKYQLMSYSKAIIETHFPSAADKLEKARYRLAFDELFLLQLKALQKKWQWQQTITGHNKKISRHPELGNLIAKLPYQLTTAQLKTLEEVMSDLANDFPMSRLLQGDVGSGKTIVAGLAIFNALKNGFQAALMAPTEILAEQHHKTIGELFSKFNFNIQFLSGSVKASEKSRIYEELAAGTTDLVIGTHALIQENLTFKNLGLAVIDEQHRFGVEQRSILKSQGSPHLLSLSATPIPRTLAMTIYGDQDLSVIDEMPKGRLPIITRVVPEKKRSDAYLWIADRIKTGRQAFVICPLIDESDTMELKSVLSEYDNLQNNIFPDLKIGILHGRLKAQEKEETMTRFKANEYQILVSTSVVEVGIDVPNATIMMIEGAERFGLSQLHQFRGRVGRGEHQSYCFLFMQNESEGAKQRLKAMVDHNSGFKLAEIDLELRGPGQIFGVRQSGIPDLKMASLSDSITISKAREAAQSLIVSDPELKNYPQLAKKLEEIDKVFIKD
jgi:ATP-dependent DNA helicase RecG